MNIQLRVRDCMVSDVITVPNDAEIMQVVHLLVEHDISGVPVVDSEGQLIGILTERDCIDVALQAGYFDEWGGSVADYMSQPVETADSDDNLVDVAERLCRSMYRRFPVLSDGKLVGLISRRDVLKTLHRGRTVIP